MYKKGFPHASPWYPDKSWIGTYALQAVDPGRSASSPSSRVGSRPHLLLNSDKPRLIFDIMTVVLIVPLELSSVLPRTTATASAMDTPNDRARTIFEERDFMVCSVRRSSVRPHSLWKTAKHFYRSHYD